MATGKDGRGHRYKSQFVHLWDHRYDLLTSFSISKSSLSHVPPGQGVIRHPAIYHESQVESFHTCIRYHIESYNKVFMHMTDLHAKAKGG